MIVGKVYRSLDELSDLPLKIKDDLFSRERWNNHNYSNEDHWLIVEVKDLSGKKYAYGIVTYNETNYFINNVIYTNQSEYLIDCCIRMLVREGFDKNYEVVLAEIETSNKNLQEIFALIGFDIGRKTESSIKMNITAHKFSKHNCNEST